MKFEQYVPKFSVEIAIHEFWKLRNKQFQDLGHTSNTGNSSKVLTKRKKKNYTPSRTLTQKHSLMMDDPKHSTAMVWWGRDIL